MRGDTDIMGLARLGLPRCQVSGDGGGQVCHVLVVGTVLLTERRGPR